MSGTPESWSLIQPVRDGETLYGFIAIHRGNKEHPAFGATRIQKYEGINDALRDVLNLSYQMSHKAALAGILYGGGKGVLLDGPHMATQDGRARALHIYAEHVNRLGGKFITGSDAGVTQEDVDYMSTHSPHIVGIKEDPTTHTALGLLHSIEVVAGDVLHKNDLSEISIAIQGLGKVGGALLHLLYDKVGHIVIADISEERAESMRARFPNVHVVSPEEILFQAVDILIPCALGGVFTASNVHHIRARAIVGSANNQLNSDEVGDMLHEQGIFYAPDYLVNSGGLISVVHEFEESADSLLLAEKVLNIKSELRNIIKKSQEERIAMHRIANRTAQEKIEALFSKNGMTSPEPYG